MKDTKTYFLSLGSNVGDQLNNLLSAEGELSLRVGKIIKKSSYYITDPWGYTKQATFINSCLLIKSEHSPTEMLSIIKAIEVDLGRKTRKKWGPRLIDIDIIFFNKSIVRSPNLVIPHPYMHERKFVLSPMLEIAPQFVHPVLNKTIEELYIHNIL